MAKIDIKLNMEVAATLQLNAREASALGALAGYGTDKFLKVFYEHMGESYLKPYEAGLRSLFATVVGSDDECSRQISDVRKAIAEFHQKRKKVSHG